MALCENLQPVYSFCQYQYNFHFCLKEIIRQVWLRWHRFLIVWVLLSPSFSQVCQICLGNAMLISK